VQTLSNQFNYRARVEPKTADGAPARVDGAPKWTLDNAAAATLVVEEDGLSALIVTADTGDAVEVGLLVVEADADLGEGVTPVRLELQLVVGPPPAESLGVTFEPVPKAVE
jgi:hypothetical protein